MLSLPTGCATKDSVRTNMSQNIDYHAALLTLCSIEHANMTKGKKSRMTNDRYKKLDDLGFKWSVAMPSRVAPKEKAEAGQDAAVVKAEDGTPAKNGTPRAVGSDTKASVAAAVAEV